MPDDNPAPPRARALRQVGRRWARAAAPPQKPKLAHLRDGVPAYALQGAAGGPRKPKLAHLFLVRDNLHQEALWEEFFSQAGDRASIYVHPKWPEKVTTRLFRRRIIPGLCATQYGRVSLVQAELRLLGAAVNDPANQFFLLHSESCIPLRPFGQVYEEVFGVGKSWLNCNQGNMERHEQIVGAAVPREHFYKTSQFFCLSRRHAERALANRGLAAWSKMFAPEEHYFATVLAAQGRLGEIRARRDLTFADWGSGRHETPCGPTTFHTLLPEDVAKLRATDCAFARKFAPDSDVSQYIRIGESRATHGGQE